ncbi:DUF1775 domain-containing protein [Lysinibacter sp. HNR]|uniref:DUF1775 domain-containing protein n=1 Tax=Lysinibacter sp. HNR TaxID=3031408 RepID=UPI0024359A75|nr:DUF1775 domain-containing protein [Lysinibacter sp. HNR]WGD37834.1 DUF1775 domain-containing protein [Lysinibacter sp. HNR]
MKRYILPSTIVGGLLAISFAPAAQAHVVADPTSISAGERSTVSFTFEHGCDASPTTGLVVSIPEGVESVAPVLDPAWNITTQMTGDVITSVTYQAVEPVVDGIFAAAQMRILTADDVAGETLSFPTLQTCEVGETNWSEIAESGQDAHSLDLPAPVVSVFSADSNEQGTIAVVPASEAAPPVDIFARVLSIIAIVAALAAGGSSFAVARSVKRLQASLVSRGGSSDASSH